MKFVALLAAALVAGCASGETTTVRETATVELTTTVQETTTVVEAAPVPTQNTGEDPDDVGGLLDVETVTASRQGDLVAVSITTHDEWAQRDVTDETRLSILYDIDRDGEADYTGEMVSVEGALALTISGEGQAFEPVPIERPDDRTAQLVHPVDVFFVPSGASPEADIQVAVTSTFGGEEDRAPDEGWVVVPFSP